ncbi:MAG: MotA/TolQ/ExbB proton channel family protein [Pseudomonadota bacterium]|nr:MotA/TolQ/ExbB proton channel family protein [Pseudomonadota bacterium]MEC9392111.1 MotA/TolQ/ExbB proton channel family protein [Pseudomonadota bacterium]
MAKIEQPKSNGLLRSLLLLAIILFGFWILNDQGLMQVVLKGDKSHISKAIIILWMITTIYWVYLSRIIYLDKSIIGNEKDFSLNLSIGKYLRDIDKDEDKETIIRVFESEYAKKLSFGWVAADISLKLGLLGTVIGFILMLQPISELNNTSPDELKSALSSMSSGMAVALFTTLTGLVSSILIRLQFQITSSNVVTLINELNFLTEKNIER